MKRTVGYALMVALAAAPAAAQTDRAPDTDLPKPFATSSAAFSPFEAQNRTADRKAARNDRTRESESELYEQGWDAADDARWDRAIALFNRVIEMNGSRADAALYWKAYAQNRLGQRAEALATITQLNKSHPNSRYGKQAAQLEAEVRRDVGQPVRPQDSADDDVKLLALQALQHRAPEEAIPMIEKVLEGTSSPRVKRRALFVLAQSDSPRARDVLVSYAKGGSTPELQIQAIQYLGIHDGPESHAVLDEVYRGTSDVDVKRRVLRAFAISGEKERVLKAAQTEQDPELRAEAVNQLGVMSAQAELWQLYQSESAPDVRRRIIRAMHVAGNVDRLIEIAKVEKDPDLRREAIRGLGLTGSPRTGEVLVQLYRSEADPQNKKAVMDALFVQGNDTALVALARQEQNDDLKRQLVERLSRMNTKVATDYMLELLGK